MASLSQAEIDQYHDLGYVVPRFRLDSSRLEVLRAALERVLEKNPQSRPERLVSIHIGGRNTEGVHGDDEFLALARDPDILDLVEQLIGPDVILWGCQSFCKPGGDGMEVPWHQDGYYWPMRPRATCSLWIALDDSTSENGCMRVIPGSHKRGLLGHHTRNDEGSALNQELSPDEFDASQAREVALQAGQVSPHDIFIAHGSCANTSDQPRTGLVYRYMPGTSHFDRSTPAVPGTKGTSRPNYADRPIFLLRGKDRTGKNDFQIGH